MVTCLFVINFELRVCKISFSSHINASNFYFGICNLTYYGINLHQAIKSLQVLLFVIALNVINYIDDQELESIKNDERLSLHPMDIIIVYLYGLLDNDIYMKLLEGFNLNKTYNEAF
ncbi:hypothetical protein CR513_12857, partial [Mucuna pruriens]